MRSAFGLTCRSSGRCAVESSPGRTIKSTYDLHHLRIWNAVEDDMIDEVQAIQASGDSWCAKEDLLG